MQKPSSKTKKVLILASGNGSNFEAIVKYFQGKGLAVDFELLCDKKDANVLKRAQKLNIRHQYVKFSDLEAFLQNAGLQNGRGFDLYVLAGFMRILPKNILELMEAHKNKVVNIHPSLLPEFKGKDAIKRAFEAGISKTGVTVHFVDETLDGGKIIEMREVQASGLPYAALEAQIHALEHKMYPEIIEKLLFKKNVLVFGGGAREHALASKIAQSPYLGQLYLAKPNDGFKNLGKTIEFKDYDELLAQAVEFGADLLVVGPEKPLFDGISDMFEAKNIKTIGANKAWARLEESKIFAKEFIAKYADADNRIKTADYKAARNVFEAQAALDYFMAKGAKPPVIKADGPALGKGVYLPLDFSDAMKCAKCFLDGKFGDASRQILIEERLFGVEVSIMSLWNGDTLVSFPPACDYKRLLDDNKGPNTGGMGAYAPSRISQEQTKQVNAYLKALLGALKRSKADFTGVIYSGLILTDDGVYVLEYNMRFGDPETQALLELLDDTKGCDLLDIFIKMSQKRLNEADLKFKDGPAYCLTLASEGYPENPKRDAEIRGIYDAEKYGVKIYFAGVKADKTGVCHNNNGGGGETGLFTNGGRVMSIVKSCNASDNDALGDIYLAAQKIQYDGKIFRRDIGK